ncbi:thiopeptide-type bacteriocin biosynthesis protein [Streptomyces sp. DSM 44917]|uniref:Thiopeptide-type bacteriocin biosynthesis protein n=1 Tax=Streptomyces boetiae TaxID=3075541 RepID=A0ABU2L703_9ACTN|nr:thiopeptide-type bacteriocin biosynthesis protein [Streptomyces sp. DSM 44917]MDT0307344.1 thiopeptide-type bacteriocin biosynthesis protein [Streptomyces sp. DSM 44917]
MDHKEASALEAAILAVLTGTPVREAATQACTSPARLADMADRYRAAGVATLDTQPTGWHQVNIEFTDYPTAEHAFRAFLLPSLRADPVGGWWFVRKHPCWRLRVQPDRDARGADTVSRVAEALDHAASRGAVQRWWPSLYEPETVAFGGTYGMTLSHMLFHVDSVGVLDHHERAADGACDLLGPKETSLLLITAFLRVAGLEWGEQGDVWGQVEEHRPLPPDVPQGQVGRMAPPLRRLLALDTDALLADGPLTPLRTWVIDVRSSGRALGHAARAGSLRIGLRSVLARHVLFHWNRMGFTTRQQAIWARAAREAILGR